jgi:predicted transposase YbfD/YdcC
LELAKNKYAVEVVAETDLIKTLDIIKTAVLAGELDAQIDAAATKLHAGFVK